MKIWIKLGMGYVTKRFSIDNEKILYRLVDELQIPLRAGKRLIDKGRVSLEGERVLLKGVRASGEVSVLFFEPTPITQLYAVFETPDFAVFEKPPFMLTHPNGFHTTECLLDSIRSLYGYNANAVHRLDFETSGLIVVSKHKIAEAKLKTIFEERGVQKEYTALLIGRLSNGIHRVECMVDPRCENGVSEDAAHGKHSLSLFETCEYFPLHDMTLVRVKPHTGRFHQIRIHAHKLGHRIAGEPLYGYEKSIRSAYLDKVWTKEERISMTSAGRICLHASKITLAYGGHQYDIVSHMDAKTMFLQALTL